MCAKKKEYKEFECPDWMMDFGPVVSPRAVRMMVPNGEITFHRFWSKKRKQFMVRGVSGDKSILLIPSAKSLLISKPRDVNEAKSAEPTFEECSM